ncbi:N-6 DNA methylase (plasmid) [Bradyrhizobium sp. 62B]|uniref:HsdM family class I SAM-dependent methyltransferase n=1 Tax=Bradyrhizobium sp. 62B TaxID=2898442 RepID=UPI002557DC59|nr:N-6 DNA methylase [Bradyrhizobium sp. 62B]
MNAELRAQKARGAFFTPPQVSQFLVDWAIRGPRDVVLEPSCGDAAFLVPAAARLQQLGAISLPNQVHGIDIHAPSVVAAQATLAEQGLSGTVTCSDFFDIDPQRRFDAVVGNPPYVRYQDFSGAARSKSLKAALAQGVRLTSLASSWAAFTIHASSLLTDEGRLALVLPAELLSVKYASAVRRFLLERFAKVKLILFEQLIFAGVLEEVVLVLAEGRGKSKHFEVYQSRDAEGLLKLDMLAQQEFAPVDNEKWTPALIPANALETYRQITSAPANFAKLVDWGETYLGSVTGNNDYFTFDAEGLKAAGLRESEVLKISPPGSRHLRGLTFTTAAWEQQVRDGGRCFLFAPSDKPSKAALAYIAKGEKSNVHKAYKCAVRDPWWRVPLVDQPDLLFTYMNHDRPRLISNDAQALVLNSLYGVKLKKGLKSVGKSALPIACMNTVTLLGSEVVGRAYGGGLLKHEPREADLLPVPSPTILSAAQNELQLLKPQLTIAMRKNDIARAVELVDEVILVKHLRLGKTEVQQLRAAREALFSRRRARGKATRGED